MKEELVKFKEGGIQTEALQYHFMKTPSEWFNVKRKDFKSWYIYFNHISETKNILNKTIDLYRIYFNSSKNKNLLTCPTVTYWCNIWTVGIFKIELVGSLSKNSSPHT